MRACNRCGKRNPCYVSMPTQCKECVRARVAARREAKLEEVRAYDRARGTLPHRKQLNAKTTAEKRRTVPGYQAAHNAVARARRARRLVPPKLCPRCGTEPRVMHAHHADYLKPLDVTWLCPSCHAKENRA